MDSLRSRIPEFGTYGSVEGLCQERALRARCCIRDEGRSFEADLQEQASNSRKLLQSERLR